MSPRRKPVKRAAPKPIVDECDECGGTGQRQQLCENCREPLTTANWNKKNECYACNQCVALDNAPHPNGGFAHYGCRCVGCAA